MPNNPTPVENDGFQDYRRYDQQHEYATVSGVIQVPVAGRTAAHRLIRLHGGYGTRIVKWQAERSGRPPVIPSAVDGSEDTLLGTTITPSLPRPNPGSSGYDWKVTGVYEYAQNTARVPGTDAFPVGAHPFVSTPANGVATSFINSLQPSGTFTDYYTTLGESIVDLNDGAYVWPFLALAPIFSSGELI